MKFFVTTAKQVVKEALNNNRLPDSAGIVQFFFATWSPDWMSLDLFLWGFTKNLVYEEVEINLQFLEHPRKRGNVEISTVTYQTLHITWREVDFRLDVYHATEEHYFKIPDTLFDDPVQFQCWTK